MFGLEYISWKEVFVFMLLISIIWYILLFAWMHWRSREQSNWLYEENETAGNGHSKNHQPISISSVSLPSIRMNSPNEKSLPLEVDLNQEMESEHGTDLSLILHGNESDIKNLITQLNNNSQ